jgi:hypothetical protein
MAINQTPHRIHTDERSVTGKDEQVAFIPGERLFRLQQGVPGA